MKITILGEPKAKQRPRMGKGFVYTPQQTVIYENYVKACFYEQSGTKLQGQLKADIIGYFSIPKSTNKKNKISMLNGEIKHIKKIDADNLAKVILDSLNGLAYHDDSAICELTVKKLYSDNPRVEVTIQRVI